MKAENKLASDIIWLAVLQSYGTDDRPLLNDSDIVNVVLWQLESHSNWTKYRALMRSIVYWKRSRSKSVTIRRFGLSLKLAKLWSQGHRYTHAFEVGGNSAILFVRGSLIVASYIGDTLPS